MNIIFENDQDALEAAMQADLLRRKVIAHLQDVPEERLNEVQRRLNLWVNQNLTTTKLIKILRALEDVS